MTQRLKVLVIEDDPASIEVAKMQLGKHDLQILTTAWEFYADPLKWNSEAKPDLILTDLNVRWGQMSERGGTLGCFDADTVIPLGFVVSLLAVKYGIPCFIITDSNGHKDATGLLLEQIGFGAVEGQTRPLMIQTSCGMGKDWLGSVKWFDHLRDQKWGARLEA